MNDEKQLRKKQYGAAHQRLRRLLVLELIRRGKQKETRREFAVERLGVGDWPTKETR